MAITSLCLVADLAALEAAESKSEGGHTGVLLSRQAVDLSPPFAGRLREVNVRIGDGVRRGDLVAALDDRTIQQERAEASADLEEARAARTEATTRLSMAETTHRRRAGLAEAFAAEEISRAREEVELARAAVQVAEARIRQKEALVRGLDEKLSQTRLVAGFDGRVARRYRDPGQIVGPGSPVVRLISDEGLWVRFAVPLERAAELAPDGPIRVYIPSLDLSIDGSIDQIGSEVDPASGMIFCEARTDPPDSWKGPALPGRAVRVTIHPR